ncbi:hypothetical protein BC835DRAFT_1072403 [Cytidiella melzeri]|nr:hypothetical protein BC835DRAFT_1072403 [Cytidiella melzeri]
MAMLQVPAAFVPHEAEQLFDDFESRCPSPTSPSASSVDLQEYRKKKMQTTVAIREEEPHRFKIRPLKQVPVDKRPTGSPCLNFDRPFAGPRLELPTLYQLPPNRLASVCSFNSLNDEPPSITQPGSPPPQKQRSRGLSSAKEAKPTSVSFEEDLSMLGLRARDSLAGSSASLRLTADENSQEHLARTLLELDVSQVSLMHSWPGAPDLTFETSDELSGTPDLNTPLTSTPSSESVRKAKSLHMDSPGLIRIPQLPLDPPALGREAIIQRRSRTKAFSVSSLSTSHSREDGRAYNVKRHAIYGDSEWQVDLPTSTSRGSSVASVHLESSPSKTTSFLKSPRFFGRKTSRHGCTKSDLLSGQGLGLKDFNVVPTLPSLPTLDQLVVLPLRITNRPLPSGTLSKHDFQDSSSTLVYHPIIQGLMQDLDNAIQGWNTAFSITSF